MATNSNSNGATMKAILLDKPGGPENMRYGETPRPTLKPKEILVRVHGTAVNRADTLQREGKYPPPPGASTIMGLECVGEVVQLGEGTSRFQVGARVMCLLAGGGYAQYVAVDEGSAMAIPEKMSYEDASTIPEAFLTAYLIARQLGGLKKDDVVMIHAGASGIGTTLIQLCKLFGAIPIVSAGSQKKMDFCKRLGAAFAINYKEDKNWSKSVKEFCSTLSPAREGVNLVLDPVGASHANENLEALVMDGRWILYGTMSGPTVDKFTLGAILRKRIRLEGSTLRARSLVFKAELVQNLERECMEAFTNGTLKPIIEAKFPLNDMAKAHELMEKNDTIGKIIITVE